MHNTREQPAIEPRIGLWDAVSMVVGIIIGAGIFHAPASVLEKVPGPYEAVGVWILGGVLALMGAFCFAELASTYPRSGGEYVYLSRAFGPWIGFLFAWTQLAIIRPAGIAAVAYVFALLWDLGALGTVLMTLAVIIILTAINVLGVTLGKATQNVLSVAKLIGLAVIIVAGLAWANPQPVSTPTVAASSTTFWLAPAMIYVLWTYAGWHEAAYITAEIKNKNRNVPWALLLGTGAVTIVYVLVNVAIVVGLGYDAARASKSPTTDVLQLLPGNFATTGAILLVMISALGATNGMIFTTARIFAVFGADHRLFTSMSHWSTRLGTPARALLVQGLLSILFTLAAAACWGGRNAFDPLIEITAAVFWLFFLLTGIALFVLRMREPNIARPFKAPLYPVLPFLFCLWCAYMMFGSIVYSPLASLVGFAIVLAGLPLYFIPMKPKPRLVREPGLVLMRSGSSVSQV